MKTLNIHLICLISLRWNKYCEVSLLFGKLKSEYKNEWKQIFWLSLIFHLHFTFLYIIKNQNKDYNSVVTAESSADWLDIRCDGTGGAPEDEYSVLLDLFTNL